MNGNTKTIAIGAIILVGTVAGYALGFQTGRESGYTEADRKIKEIQNALDTFVPPLPDVINAIGGKITGADSDMFTFVMEVPSFTDRYPRPGMPMATETRTIRVVADTKITSTNFDPETFKNGLPQTTTIAARDLKAGDTVSVTIAENARVEQNLTAVSISRSSGI